LKLSARVGTGKIFHRAQAEADRRTALALEQWIQNRGFLKEASMDEVALELGLDSRVLSYYCCNILGQPFLLWRKNLRLLEAREIIRRNPDISFALVGRMVGIPDKSNFRKLFRESFGMTPREWSDLCAKTESDV